MKKNQNIETVELLSCSTVELHEVTTSELHYYVDVLCPQLTWLKKYVSISLLSKFLIYCQNSYVSL